MPEYSSTTITPADGVKTPAMNGSTSGNYTLSALRDFILASKGSANGLASLDSNGKLPSAQLPDLADDVLVYASYASFPASGTAGKLYIAGDTNKIYRWDDSLGTPAYVYLKVDWTDLTDGSVTVKKAECDASGNTITSTYETKADANNLKSAITANSNRIANLEQKAGDYSIVQYRGTNAVPTGKAKYGLVKSIVGKTRGWNQLINATRGTDISSGVTFTKNNDGTYTLTGIPSSNNAFLNLDYEVGRQYFIQGHKYYLPKGTTSSLPIGIAVFGSGADIYAEDSGQIFTAGTLGSESWARIQVSNLSGTDIGTVRIYANLYDLTLIFGSGNEPSTVADALAQIPALGQYNAYDAGSLVDTVVSGVKSVGFNTLDELAYYNEVGAVKDSDGYYTATADDWHDHVFNEIKFKSNMVYNFHFTIKNNGVGNPQLVIYYTDGTEITYYFESGDGTYDKLSASGKSIDSFRMSYGSASTNTYGVKDFCINLSQPNTSISPHNGEYYPYKTDTLSLPEPVTFRSASNSFADTVNVETGKIVRKCVSYTITGDETYEFKAGTQDGHYAVLINYPTEMSDVRKVLDAVVKTDLGLPYNYANNDKVFYYSPAAFVIINDDWTTEEVFMQNIIGKTFVSALTNFVTEQATPIPDNTILTEGGGTIDTIQEQSPVIDNCLDVGYLTV